MTDKEPQLIVDPSTPAPPRPPRRLWPIGLLALALAVAGIGGYLVYRAVARPQPATPGWTAIELSLPALGPERADGPWISLTASPLSPGQNQFVAALHPTKTASASSQDVRQVRIALTPLVPDGEGSVATVKPAGGGTFAAEANLPTAGWWRVTVTVDADGLGTATVPFDLMVPDPNLNGVAAVPQPDGDPEAEKLYEQALASLTGLRTVRFWQTMANGRGVVALSDHAVRSAASGETPGFTYHAYTGLEAVVIGDRMWSRDPGEPWEEAEASQMVDPSAWGEEYNGATSFQLGGEMMVGRVPCRLVAFRTPDLTEPRTQVAAWYLWWVAPNGDLLREAMISRAHYMTNDFVEINQPLALTPPIGPATPGAATPAR